MRLVLPDAALTAAVDANRAYALLGAAPAGAEDDPPLDALATWRRVRELMERASPTYTWAAGDDGDDAGTGGEFLRAVRRLLIRTDDAGLALCSLYPPEWAGQPVEVHDAPTAHGRVSFAVRWHGTSPALLWECERPGVRLTAPGLDATWATAERTGEALLRPFRGRVAIPLNEAD
jgi:hypothetical protein